jgi:hypothetical protein
MTSLEDIRNGATVRGIAPNQAVQVVSVDWIGDQAINIVFRNHDGAVFGAGLVAGPVADNTGVRTATLGTGSHSTRRDMAAST